MRILISLMLLIASLTAFAADKATDVFTLDHQMSSMCEKKIITNLRYEKGVSNIVVSLKENTITISFDPKKTDREKLIKAFKKIGFVAMPVEVCPQDRTSVSAQEAAPSKSCCPSH